MLANANMSFADEIIDGIYIGWEKASDISPYDKSEVWYHQHKLTIDGNSANIEASPRSIKNDKIKYSSSEGGFYTYKGAIFMRDGRRFIRLRIVNCDYCPRPVTGLWPDREYPIHFKNEVSFEFNSVIYVLQDAK